MSKFSYGEEFLRLNAELLDLYAGCKDGQEVVEAQNRWLEEAQAAKLESSESEASDESEYSSDEELSDTEKVYDALGNLVIN